VCKEYLRQRAVVFVTRTARLRECRVRKRREILEAFSFDNFFCSYMFLNLNHILYGYYTDYPRALELYKLPLFSNYYTDYPPCTDHDFQPGSLPLSYLDIEVFLQLRAHCQNHHHPRFYQIHYHERPRST
jgi:hypothetical protein